MNISLWWNNIFYMLVCKDYIYSTAPPFAALRATPCSRRVSYFFSCCANKKHAFPTEGFPTHVCLALCLTVTDLAHHTHNTQTTRTPPTDKHVISWQLCLYKGQANKLCLSLCPCHSILPVFTTFTLLILSFYFFQLFLAIVWIPKS